MGCYSGCVVSKCCLFLAMGLKGGIPGGADEMKLLLVAVMFVLVTQLKDDGRR